MKTLKGMTFAVLLVVLAGCASHAIVPFRMTYTYPVAEACQYASQAACGAVAFWNDRSLELYLPYQQKSFDARPARYEFTPADARNETWLGKRANTRGATDIKARFVLADQEATNPSGFRELRGMLVVEFPADAATHGDLAGKTIWLSPAVGWENVKLMRGLFWEGESRLPESVGIRFSKD